MIKIKKYAVWKGNKIIKLSDDKDSLVKFIIDNQEKDQFGLWLAKRDGTGWISEPLWTV